MRVLKFQLNTGMNTIRELGSIKLVCLDYQDNKLMGWFVHTDNHDAEPSDYEVYVALTGEQVPDEYNYVCTAQLNRSGGYFVVHGFD